MLLNRPVRNKVAAIVVVVAVILAGILIYRGSHAASGWLSGASSAYVPDGSFGAWRGEEASVSGTYFDNNVGQIEIWSIKPPFEYANWSKPLDVAMGAIDENAGETWAAAAGGAYDSRWRQSAQNMKAAWTDNGKPEGNLMIRFAHEMNGDWYPWKVAIGDEANFRAAYARWSNIVHTTMPLAKRIFNVNKNSSGGMAMARNLWPGKQYADIYSVDWYNTYPWCNTTSCLDSEFNKRSSDGGPWGVETQRQQAEAYGVPFAISEWGNQSNPASGGGGGESPELMTYMNNWMRAHAGTGTGQLYYEIYFNLWTDYQLYGTDSRQPATAARYQSLVWGDGGVSSTPPPIIPLPGPPTPTPVPPAPPVVSQISQNGNLAIGKTFVSSVPDSTTEFNHPVSNVNDKTESTRWISQPADNVTLTTDLGASQNISKVSILWAGDTTKNYDLQISADNVNWTTMSSGVTNNVSPQLIDTTSFTGATTGRYFRIVAKDRWNASYGNSIWELGIYGAATATPAPTTARVNQAGNLLSGKTLKSSAGDSTAEPGHPASYANDKNEATRWISQPTDNVTLSADLGSPQKINKVSVLWAGDTVKDYDLQISPDNINWTTMATGATNNTSPQLIDTTSFTGATTGRYFRISAKDRWNQGYGNSIWELGVYGTAASVSQAANLVAGKTFKASVPDSSTEPGHPASFANDGNEYSRWISQPLNNVSLIADMGSTKKISKVSILWAGDTVKNYELQVSSDKLTWTKIATGVTTNLKKQRIDTTTFTGPTTGRYFRILCKDRWNVNYGNSIWEVGVYGSSVASAGGFNHNVATAVHQMLSWVGWIRRLS